MGNEAGQWIMYGVDWDDPECIHTVEEAITYINEVGFLPLFKNEIPGFSLEERTVPEYWWCDDPERDPWMWRAVIARKHDIVYGKFFDKKAGFISRQWLPVFANYRRDGYDFDALYEDVLVAYGCRNDVVQTYVADDSRLDLELLNISLIEHLVAGLGLYRREDAKPAEHFNSLRVNVNLVCLRHIAYGPETPAG